MSTTTLTTRSLLESGLEEHHTENASYTPSENEPFMNPKQLDFFRDKLENWKQQLLKKSKQTIHSLQGHTHDIPPDMIDHATRESEKMRELRSRDRERKVIVKIDEALQKIEDGTYGYCEETGEPINIRRLHARPIATLCIEAQEQHERKKRVHQDEWL